MQRKKAIKKLLRSVTIYSKVWFIDKIFMICSQIIYVDGGTENLTQDELDRLLRDRMWTKQVLLLQAFVPMISLQTGAYSHAPQVSEHLNCFTRCYCGL